MKLLTKINRTYFKYGLFVFLLADFIVIVLSYYILRSEIDQELRLEAQEIVETLKKQGYFQNIYPTATTQKISSSPTTVNSITKKDTVLYDAIQQELAPFREHSRVENINGQIYKVTTRHMLMELNDIFTLFTSLISVVLLFIFIGFLLFTRQFNFSIWKGFNDNAKALKSFSFASQSRLCLQETGIEEFDELNKVLLKMANRLQTDYQASKEFASNVAHEFQTPLAIIRNKCENLFSDAQLKEEVIVNIRDIYSSADRLSGITKALLLLAKIDHGQFHEDESVSISEIIQNWLTDFREIIQEKGLILSIQNKAECSIKMDRRLANLMAQNIVSNAITHSEPNKKVCFSFSENQFTVSNFGTSAIQQPDQIFNRFYREGKSNTSTGIGLTILKKITDHYGISIHYSFQDFNHFFTFKLPDC